MEAFVHMQILVHNVKQVKELLAHNTLTKLKILPTLPVYWKDTQADMVFPLH
jgi:abortive infection bacteriophage resistance protein